MTCKRFSSFNLKFDSATNKNLFYERFLANKCLFTNDGFNNAKFH